MQDNTARLSALIGSRICHDLISPIGAISNGLELMQLTADGTDTGPEMALINDSCANARARVRFFRVAFGTCATTQQMGQAEIRDILAALQPGSRVKVDWQIPDDVSRRDVQLCFLALMCCEAAMPKGGDVVVTRVGGDLVIRGLADQTSIDRGLWDALTGRSGIEFTPADVQFLLLSLLARDLGRPISLDLRDRRIDITVGA